MPRDPQAVSRAARLVRRAFAWVDPFGPYFPATARVEPARRGRPL